MKTLDDLARRGRVRAAPCWCASDLNVPLDGSEDHRRRPDPGPRCPRSAPCSTPVPGWWSRLTSARPEARCGPTRSSRWPRSRAGWARCSPARRSPSPTTATRPPRRAGALADGGVVLLENIRFDPARDQQERQTERAALAAELAALAGPTGAFVSDGFGVVHRKQASVFDVAQLLPAYTGGLVRGEVEVLRQLTTRSGAALRGGARRRQGLGQAPGHRRRCCPRSPRCWWAAAWASRSWAQGHPVWGTRCWRPTRSAMPPVLEPGKWCCRWVSWWPLTSFGRGDVRTVPVEKIPDGRKALDIGPASVGAFAQVLATRRPCSGTGRPDVRVRPVRGGHPRCPPTISAVPDGRP